MTDVWTNLEASEDYQEVHSVTSGLPQMPCGSLGQPMFSVRYTTERQPEALSCYGGSYSWSPKDEEKINSDIPVEEWLAKTRRW